MKIKLDENIPAVLVSYLRALDHDVDSVPGEGLAGAVDEAVWIAAQREQRFFITLDLDFSDARRYQPGTHAGILLLRLSRSSRSQVEQYLRKMFQTEDVQAWEGCFVVATDRKIRILRPTS